MKVTLLAAEGRRMSDPVAGEKSEAGWKIPVGDPAATWYLVEME